MNPTDLSPREAIFMVTKEFLGQAAILTVPRTFIQFFKSYEQAVFFSQILYWQQKVNRDWFYKKLEDWEDELCIPQRTLRFYLSQFKKAGYIETKVQKVNGTPLLHYRVNVDRFLDDYCALLAKLPNNSTDLTLLPNEPGNGCQVEVANFARSMDSATVARSINNRLQYKITNRIYKCANPPTTPSSACADDSVCNLSHTIPEREKPQQVGTKNPKKGEPCKPGGDQGDEQEEHEVDRRLKFLATELTEEEKEEAFEEEFWPAYPKKRGKAVAYKAWMKLFMTHGLKNIILRGLEQQKKSPDWRKEGGKYIPYPATWLNQRRWEDELEVKLDD